MADWIFVSTSRHDLVDERSIVPLWKVRSMTGLIDSVLPPSLLGVAGDHTNLFRALGFVF